MASIKENFGEGMEEPVALLMGIKAFLKSEKAKRLKEKERLKFQEKQKHLEEIIRLNSNLDLVFVMDCTGSMYYHIRETQRQMVKIVEACRKEFENKIRVGFVGYRGHCDGNDRITGHPLTEDTAKVVDFLSRTEAKGGEGYCADVFGGLEEAINMDWQYPTRVMIHSGDMPQHGSRFHEGAPSIPFDSFENCNDKDHRGLRVEDLLMSIKEKKINYFFGKITNYTDKMIKVFRATANDKNIVTDVNMKDPDDILKNSLMIISLSINSSILKTLSTKVLDSFKNAANLKSVAIVEEMPTWDEVEAMEVKRMEFSLDPDLDLKSLKNGIKWKKSFRREKIKKGDSPFAEGAERICFHGVRCVDGDDEEEEVVIKDFKDQSQSEDEKKDYVALMKTQTLAAFMAKKFNKLLPPTAKKIRYLDVSVYEGEDEAAAPIFFNVEEVLPDYKEKFTKWCNNVNYIDKSQVADPIFAFCHWTFDVTDEYLMVVDIQGVDTDSTYVLTDPAIHCIDDEHFGDTNFGMTGIKTFFKAHDCNDICRHLKLKTNKYQKSEAFQSG